MNLFQIIDQEIDRASDQDTISATTIAESAYRRFDTHGYSVADIRNAASRRLRSRFDPTLSKRNA